MSKSKRPPVAAEVKQAWLLLGLVWATLGAGGIIWSAGCSASLVAGHGWVGPPFDFTFAVNLFKTGPAGLWPTVPPGLVWALIAVYLAATVAVLVGVARLVRRFRADDEREDGTAPVHVTELESLSPKRLANSTGRLRPSLAGVKPRRLQPAQVGFPIGFHDTGVELRGSWEESTLVIMAPRGGKTTSFAAPAILDAPGPVVVTSAKADIWAMTARPRHDATGSRPWVFDPSGLTPLPQSWWWNPLADIRDYTMAERLAGHFAMEVRGGTTNEFFLAAAHDLLASLILAAAAGGGTFVDVARWLRDSSDPTPETVLAETGHDHVAHGLAARRAGAAIVTREGIWETARTMARCLQHPAVLNWIAPNIPPGPAFHPRTFVESSADTIYLLSRSDHGSAAPVVAALTDILLHEADMLAVRRGGRLDPPISVVLDEAANICKIPTLPAFYSTAGSKGIVATTILQSRPQGREVWDRGFETLWSAATIKLIGAGIDDPDTLTDLQRLVGDHDVETATINLGRGGHGTVSMTTKPVLPASQIRGMPKGTALLLATGCPATTIRLRSVHDGPHAAVVADAMAHAGDQYELPVSPVASRLALQPPDPVLHETAVNPEGVFAE